MSTAKFSPADYATGSDRYINFAEDFLDKRLAGTQEKILRAVANNRRVLIISGNGVGKSYVVAILADSFLYTNPDSTSLGTSGSYSQFVDTMWRPMSSMAKKVKEEHGLPGQVYEGNQPKIEIDSEWYFKVVSPRDPGDLEGRHASECLVIIEEADKRYITEEHFDSAGSTITDASDRMVAVANPPKSESNVVYDKMQSDRWTVIQFSSFESHNVKVDTGEIDDEHLPGLVDLPTIAEDYEAWNNEPWPQAEEAFDRHFGGEYPGVSALNDRLDAGSITREELLTVLRPGVSEAKNIHERRDDLDTRWYRRRAGIIPPESSSSYKPWSVSDVEDAYNRDPDIITNAPQGVGIDVARMGGDANVLSGKHGDLLKIHERWSGVDHNVNERMIRNYIEGWPDVYVSIDAQGEGSALADRCNQFIPSMVRFNAGETAAKEQDFYDRWTEGLYQLGQFIRKGGCIRNRKLREEMLAAARVVEFEEKYYSSRDDEVIKATSKDEVKEELGRSPDALDSGIMAVWSASDAPESEHKTQRLVW